MNNHNGPNIPMLGAKKDVRAASDGIMVMPRKLDENGTFTPQDVVMGPNGAIAIAGRSNYVDAEELVEMIVDAMRPVIRAEVAVALRKQGA